MTHSWRCPTAFSHRVPIRRKYFPRTSGNVSMEKSAANHHLWQIFLFGLLQFLSHPTDGPHRSVCAITEPVAAITAALSYYVLCYEATKEKATALRWQCFTAVLSRGCAVNTTSPAIYFADCGPPLRKKKKINQNQQSVWNLLYFPLGLTFRSQTSSHSSFQMAAVWTSHPLSFRIIIFEWFSVILVLDWGYCYLHLP